MSAFRLDSEYPLPTLGALASLETEKICALAKKIARHHYHRTSAQTQKQRAEHSLSTHEYGINVAKLRCATTDGRVKRLRSESFWRRELNSVADTYREIQAKRCDALGSEEKGKMPFCSDRTLAAFRERQDCIKAKAIGNEHMQYVSLQKKRETAKFKQLYLTLKSMDSLAQNRRFSWMLLTLTCPPEYHSNSINYQGLCSKDANTYLAKTWQKIGKALSKDYTAGTHFFGARFVEAHENGTPHWHVLLYFTPGLNAVIEQKLHRIYSTEEFRPSDYLSKYKSKVFIYPKLDGSIAEPARPPLSYLFKMYDWGKSGQNSEALERHRYALRSAGIRRFQLIGAAGLSGKVKALAKAARSSNAPVHIKEIANTLARPSNTGNRVRQLEAFISFLDIGLSSLKLLSEKTVNKYGEAGRRVAALSYRDGAETFTLKPDTSPRKRSHSHKLGDQGGS